MRLPHPPDLPPLHVPAHQVDWVAPQHPVHWIGRGKRRRHRDAREQAAERVALHRRAVAAIAAAAARRPAVRR